MTIRWLHRRRPNEPVARCGLGATLVILAAMPGLFSVAVSAEPRPAPRAETATASARSAYVGSAACSRCHAEIYQSYAKTSMGRSMSPVTQDFLQTLPLPATVYDSKSNRHYEVHAEDGKLVQSEFALDAVGRETFRSTHAINWIIGAELNGLGGLVRRGDYITEAPLSYYSKLAKWDLSPGYQRGDYAFNRLIAPGCIACHTGRAQPVAGSDGKYDRQPFTQLAIGCENCHGPGGAHVEAMGEGASYTKGHDPTIMNPAEMKAGLANDLCMSCHQTGDARVYQPGKTAADYRPGLPLERFVAILMVPPTREKPPQEDHVEHSYSMMMSKCYRATVGLAADKQLRCISCHDPHVEPTAAEAPAYFNGKCMSCHTEQSCKATVKVRQAAADNCINCHMPKRAGVSISHSTLTNHRIVARPDEPFPDAAFAMTTPGLPDLIYLNGAPVDPAAHTAGPLDGVTLLKAYEQLKGQYPAYETAYAKTLEDLARTAPNEALVQATLGHQALAASRWDEAQEHLSQAIKLDPIQPAAYADLAAVAGQQGQAAEAVALQQKAVMLDPYNTGLRKQLVLRLIDARQYPEAEAAMEAYLADFPEDDFMRKMLAIAKEP